MLRSAKGARDATTPPTQPPKSPLKASSKQQPADIVRLDDQIVAPAVEAHNIATMSVAAAAGAAARKSSNAGVSSVSSLASVGNPVRNPAGTPTSALGGPQVNSTASLAGAGRAYQGASAMASLNNVAGPGANVGIFDSIVEGASLTSLNAAGATSGQPSKSGGESEELPKDFTTLFDLKLFKFDTGLMPEAMKLYEFETPLPPLQPAVFPPALRELPPPSLDLFDLDEQFASEKVRLAQLANK
ncbi:Intraflagellar transport protein 52, partial [Cladochytrium tenue]